MFKHINITWMIMMPILLYAQLEYTHPLPNNIATIGAKKIKAMEEDRALIFSIDYQPDRIDNYITKVDYDGNELFSIQINIDNYKDVMLIEGIEHDGSYILIGTAVDASDNKPYFITVQCESDLTEMRIADRHPIQYPVFTSYSSAKIQNDSDTGHYGFVFNTGPWKDQTREMLFASFDIEGQIYSFDSFDNGSLFIDHIYSSDTKKHYIVAGKKIIIYSEEKGIERYFDFFVELNEIKYFNIEYNIISADDHKINLLGRWGSKRELYNYTIYLDDEGWQQGPYNEDVFPDKRYYILLKTIMPNNNAIASVSTDLSDVNYYDPNEIYFWEFDTDGQIIKTYKFETDQKTHLAILDVDKNCNILGLGGVATASGQNVIYFIMPCDNKYVVATEDAEIKTSSFLTFPNPTTHTLFIPNEYINASVIIYNMIGQEQVRKQISSDNDTQLDVSQLVPGTYIISASKLGHVYHSKFIKL